MLTPFFCSKSNPLYSARVMRDESGRSRGFGFVSYQTPTQGKWKILPQLHNIVILTLTPWQQPPRPSKRWTDESSALSRLSCDYTSQSNSVKKNWLNDSPTVLPPRHHHQARLTPVRHPLLLRSTAYTRTRGMVMDNKGTEAMGTEGGTGQVPLARRRARAGSVWQDGRDIVQERAIRRWD